MGDSHLNLHKGGGWANQRRSRATHPRKPSAGTSASFFSQSDGYAVPLHAGECGGLVCRWGGREGMDCARHGGCTAEYWWRHRPGCRTAACTYARTTTARRDVGAARTAGPAWVDGSGTTIAPWQGRRVHESFSSMIVLHKTPNIYAMF